MRQKFLKNAARAAASVLTCLLAAVLAIGCTASSGSTDAENAAAGNAVGVIAWAKGGGTDSIMRPLAEQVNNLGGRKLDVVNRTGMVGALALQQVLNSEADGGTLLMSAENPALYELLGYGEEDYEDFDCVLLIGSETVGVVVGSDSRFNTFTEIIEAAKDGQEILEATTNVGGMPWTLTAMVQGITGAQFTQVWYDGDKSAMEAVKKGEADFTFCKLQIGEAAAKNGEIRYLSMISDEAVNGFETVPLITEEYPDFADYLPWGPFYGVFVKKGTSEEVTKEWVDLFQKAYETDDFQMLLADGHIHPLGLSGEEAAGYIKQWKEKTVSILSQLDLNLHYRFDAE